MLFCFKLDLLNNDVMSPKGQNPLNKEDMFCNYNKWVL